MIQQSNPIISTAVPHTEHLKSMVQSLFHFQEDALPKNFSKVDISTITYVNYKKVIETIQSTLTIIKSEVVNIDPAGLKDSLFLIRLAMDRAQYDLNLIDTRLEHLHDFLEKKPRWFRFIKWTHTNDAYNRYHQLEDNQKQASMIWDYLSRSYIELRYTIRQQALTIVKSHSTHSDNHYIMDIQTLEGLRNNLLQLFHEIEDVNRQTKQSQKIVFYATDRDRFINVLQNANIAIKSLSFQLSKVHLENSLVTPELMRQIFFEKKHRLRWNISDKFVYRVLMQRFVPLKNLIDGLDLLLQPESHKLNTYANRVTNLGYLMRYTPSKTIPEMSKLATSSPASFGKEGQTSSERGSAPLEIQEPPSAGQYPARNESNSLEDTPLSDNSKEQDDRSAEGLNEEGDLPHSGTPSEQTNKE